MTNKNNIEQFIANTFLLLCCLCIIIGIAQTCSTSSTPVESNEQQTVDSLTIDNSLIKTEVNNLDSMKNEEINNVVKLDNDSTLKLFYKLLGK